MNTDNRSDSSRRLYGGIDLIGGVGDRGRGKLCVMSFVALLAGERHGDHPDTASPMIMAFAFKLNDAMDIDARQRLLNTRDGRDEARSEMLVAAIVNEIVPQVLADIGGAAAMRIDDWRDGGRRIDSSRLAHL